MATADGLRAQIAAAQQVLSDRTSLTSQLDAEIAEANERFHLRRELKRVQKQIVEREDVNERKRQCRVWIDNDMDIAHMPDDSDDDEGVSRRQSRPEQASLAKCCEEIVSCSEVVAKGEYVWTIKGLSWLVSTLEQNGECCAKSDMFSVGGEDFFFVYHPKAGRIGSRGVQKGSLAIKHHSSHGDGITFRYKICILGSGGDYVQWGNGGDECHPDENTYGWVFGPDVQIVDRCTGEHSESVGIFGLSHTDLLASEWVVNDALTVKFALEVRPDSEFFTVKSHVEVPPATLGTNLLTLLDEGRCSDVTFIVDGEPLIAHSQILCSRSEVFDRLLNGGLREATSREIIVEDCDVATFRAFLKYIYTDDLKCIEDAVQKTCAAGSGSAACDVDAAKIDSVPNVRMSFLQSMLAVSHKYQILRLQRWCEQQLCQGINVMDVCSVLCQAHLYEARQLEETSLVFIKENMDKVVITPAFGSLGREWPEVMLKINVFVAGVSASSAAAAIEAQRLARRNGGVKRKRAE